MASASPDNIKQWKFPDGVFLQNLSGHNAILNTLALNQDNVLVSGGKYEVKMGGQSFIYVFQ
jgi:pleiotropic regulator 1